MKFSSRIAGIVLCFSLVCGVVPSASAQTTNIQATQATINSLLQLLQSLQAQLAELLATQSSSGDSSEDILTPASLAGRQMQATAYVRVRATPSSTGFIITTIPAGTIGTVLAGPVDPNGNAWWKVKYQNGVTGWTSGAWLVFLETPSTAAAATCSLGTNKNTYVVNEPVLMSWSSGAAAKVWFSQTSAALGLNVSTSDVAAEGDQKAAFTKVGTYTLTLNVVDADGHQVSCTQVFKVTPPTVTLRVNGIDTTSFSANLFDSLEVVNLMHGDIVSCTLSGEYERGTLGIPKQIWNRWLEPNTADEYGRAYFSAVSSAYGKGLGSLKRIRAFCETKGYGTIEDSVDVTVHGDESIHTLEVMLNGNVVYTGTGLNQVNAYTACVDQIDRHQYSTELLGSDVMSCTWNGQVLKSVSAWKG